MPSLESWSQEPCPSSKLSALIADYGARWQIDRQESPAGWVAIRRPTPTQVEVHCATELDDLRAKLERAEAL
jgi:hypothetical protein